MNNSYWYFIKKPTGVYYYQRDKGFCLQIVSPPFPIPPPPPTILYKILQNPHNKVPLHVFCVSPYSVIPCDDAVQTKGKQLFVFPLGVSCFKCFAHLTVHWGCMRCMVEYPLVTVR